MAWLKKYWVEFFTGLSALFGLLLYFAKKQNKTINEVKLKSDMANTEKEVDLVEAEIRQKMENNQNLKKTQQELDKALDDLAGKRAAVVKNARELKHPQDVADYWDKN
jgi:chromosome condensin MukBEF ATPase and DNA-binding subunit MukB